MFDCGWKRLYELKRLHASKYTEIVAIRPSGWSFGGKDDNSTDTDTTSFSSIAEGGGASPAAPASPVTP